MGGLIWATASSAALLLGACSEQEDALDTDERRLSYVIGYQLGKDVQAQHPSLDARTVAQGLEDMLTGAEPRLSLEEMQATVSMHLEKLRRAQQRVTEVNRKAGRIFLEQNGKKSGVVSLPSGLQYRVIQEGTGKKPAATDQVKVHYRGTLINGQEFDSSYSRGEPTTLLIDQVIDGWQEALQLMSEGARWQIFVPASLAYGTSGAGDAIGPGETLIFEIELISVL